MTWIVLTIGLNPLPCLVEIYRLCKKIQAETGALPTFLPIRDRPRNREAERIRHYLNQRLTTEAGTPVSVNWEGRDQFLTDPHDPIATRREADVAARRIPVGAQAYFAFTGGTKVMSLETLAALQARGCNVTPAYLSASSHRVLSQESVNEDPGDERRHWNLPIPVLADLHRLKYQSTPSADPSLEELSQRMLALLDDHHERRWFWDWHKDVFKRSLGIGETTMVERFNWPQKTIEWAGRNDHWRGVTELLVTAPVFGGAKVWNRTRGSWQIQTNGSLRNYLVPLYKFLENQFLEIYTWRTLRCLLPEQYAVEHSVTCASEKGKPFELDVVGVLGYQLLAISCTYAASSKTCKQKGFEVIHRARQLGGDQARAALVCLISESERTLLEDDLSEELGLEGQVIRIFGANALRDVSLTHPTMLKEQLREFLETDLQWKKLENTAPIKTP